ncbi:MAG TPA: LytTR family DNA-binding domain-containing protein [Bacteroidales bacterium]|nr:LytTR family DNA-binding domain-containing protein [Bacteroidales bacterium]
MNCIIVDDEPLAQQVMEDYVKMIPFLKLKGKCSSAFQAFDILRSEQIDLIFLDIHMPNVNGIDFISSIQNKPYFIFTTAYSEHALEGFELNAIDYLLKPIPFERFLKAVNKAYDIYLLKNNKVEAKPEVQEKKKLDNFILVKSDYQTQRVDLNDITYIEGLKDYVKIFLVSGKTVVTLNSLKNMADKLPENMFVRVHKSYIVSLQKINSIVRNRIIIGEKWIPVGDNYKELFTESIRKHNFNL